MAIGTANVVGYTVQSYAATHCPPSFLIMSHPACSFSMSLALTLLFWKSLWKWSTSMSVLLFA